VVREHAEYHLRDKQDHRRLSRATFSFVDLFVPSVFKIGRMSNEIIWHGTFDGKFEDKLHAIEVFEQHKEEVRWRLPPDELLVYEVKEGWGPLCEFLGVEEPDKPFPCLNDAAEMRRRIRSRRLASPCPQFWRCWS
jgi:Sulfotransferase domain